MNYRGMFGSVAVLFVVMAIAFTYLYFIPHPKADFKDETRYLLVKKTDSVHDIAASLDKIGAISSKGNFIFFVRLLGNAGRLHTGRYAMKPASSLAYIIRLMTRGEQTPFNVTIPEGYTMAQMANLLESMIDLDVKGFHNIVTDRGVLDSLQIEADDLEGYLAPATYNLFYEENPRKVVAKMTSHFFESLPDSFEIKANYLGLTLHEVVTLASMVEKEAMLDSERPTIAAVYLNRLRKGMRLECDPTVIYAMGGLTRPLARRDLEFQSPYNTYRNYGLPPGPIANPGIKSLDAAINPAPVGFLYFVAKGDGSHIFSYTLEDHINAVNRIRRQNGRG